MKARFLVTTPIEATWPEKNISVLFLGEWCKLYERKQHWGAYDFEVAPYHWNDREKLIKDYSYLKIIQEHVLHDLVSILNKVHQTNHSIRYWRILLGPWISSICPMIFDRWCMLKLAYESYQITGVGIIDDANLQRPVVDMQDFEKTYLTDEWNSLIYRQILEWMGKASSDFGHKSISVPILTKKNTAYEKVNKWNIKNFTAIILRLIGRKNKYFLITTYLEFIQEIKLNFKLYQLPVFVKPPKIIRVEPDYSLREALHAFLFDRNACRTQDDFYDLLISLIPKHIPILYLEGYTELLKISSGLGWPISPEVIFTSNSHYSDDLFKVWAAKRVNEGCKLIVGQHGGNYGVAKWSSIEDHEIAIADSYFTWGWSSKKERKILPALNFKGVGTSERLVDVVDGDILLVTVALPRYSYLMYASVVSSQWLEYFEEQVRFVNALPEKLSSRLLVRLYRQDYGWSQRDRWRERAPGVRLDDGAVSINNLIQKCAIYVSTYNATTFLESMSQNIPTLIYWNPNRWELRDDAIKFFEDLKRVGIFHESPESAAKHLTEIWADIFGWWNSESLQKVRKNFCNNYAFLPSHPLDVLAKKINEVDNFEWKK